MPAEVQVLTSPFFWAFLSAVGWAMGMLTVGSATVGRYPLYGMTGSALAQIPRAILPLPFVIDALRFKTNPAVLVIGALLCTVALAFGRPGLGLKIYTRPTAAEPLCTDGFFAVVRHPILFANVVWSIGWPLLWGSGTGLALVPVWFLLVYLMSFIEEERLVEVYGDPYRKYQREVPRILPFVRFL